MLPRTVVPLINVLLNGDAVVINCPLIAEKLIDQFLRFLTIWKERENIEADASRVGLSAIPLAFVERAG